MPSSSPPSRGSRGWCVWRVALTATPRPTNAQKGVSIPYEATHREQALQLARIEEANKGIKLTVDRIYAQVSAGQRVLHHTDKTNGPWGDA